MSSCFISRVDRENGIRYYLRHVATSEIGYNFLADTLILLLAIQLGANNLQLGYLTATVYITGLSIIIVPQLFGGLPIITAYWIVWAARGLCGLSYFAAGYLHSSSPTAAIWMLLAGYTAFSLLRNFAWPMKQSLEKILVPTENPGRTLSKINIAMNYGKLAACAASFILLYLGILNGIPGLLTLTAVGIIFSLWSALILRNIKVTETVGRSGAGAGRMLLELTKRRHFAAIILYCGNVAAIILCGFIVPMLKKLAHMPNSYVFLFALLSAAAMILAAKIMKIFSDKIGTRPLLVISFSALALIAAALPFFSTKTPWTVITAAGVAIMFIQTCLTLLISRLVLKSIPANNKVGFTSLLNFTAALVAIITGLGAGASADSNIHSRLLHLDNPYSPNFIILAALAAALAAYCAAFLRERRSVPILDACKLFLSPENLKAILLLNQLEDPLEDRLKEKLIVMNISYSASGLATEEIRRRLKNPLIDPRDDLLRSLFFFPRPELLDLLLAEASDRDSWWRETALFTLGAYPGERTEKLLLNIYNTETYPYLKSIVAKSLARIGNRQLLPELRSKLFEANPTLNIKTVVNLVISISLMDASGASLGEIWRIAGLRDSEKFRQHIFVIFSRRIGLEPGLEHFFYLENLAPGGGVRELLAETAGETPFAASYHHLAEAFALDFHKIGPWCVNTLNETSLEHHLDALASGIRQYADKLSHRGEAIAMLYFTFVCVKNARLKRHSFNWKNY